jgi:hypothetical protein
VKSFIVFIAKLPSKHFRKIQAIKLTFTKYFKTKMFPHFRLEKNVLDSDLLKLIQNAITALRWVSAVVGFFT